MQYLATPKAARLRGDRFYFTGKECPAGHIALRRANGGACVECQTATNRERAAYTKDYHKRNPQKNYDAVRKYKKTHRDRVLAQKSEYAKKYPAQKAAEAARRRASRRRATPVWADHDAIKKIYEQAQIISKASGVPHEVDHIIPLAGKNVSGLHVSWNLQILTRERNRRKHIKVE